MQKTSTDHNMTDKKPELSDAMKKKLEPKKFTKNPILGTKFTIAVSSAKGVVKRTVGEFEKVFLGEIPINPEVGKCGDEGKPIVEANPEHEISKIYLDFAKKIRATYLDN